MFNKALKVLNKTIVIMLVIAFTLVGVNSIPSSIEKTAFAEGQQYNQQSVKKAPSTPKDLPKPSNTKPEPLSADSDPGDLTIDSKKVNEIAAYKSTDDETYTELTSKRTSNIKYFLLDSKRYEAVMYGLPVHYKSNGKYVDIDNSLELKANKNGKEVYTNKANSFIVQFSSTIDDESIATVTKDKYMLSWTLDGLEKGKIGETKTNLSKDQWKGLNEGEKRRNPANQSSTITYTDVLKGIDLQYFLISDQLKESIIINEKSDIQQLSQKISTDGLVLVLEKDGSLQAINPETNKSVFYIPKPNMVDSDGNESEINIELNQDENKDYILTLNLDNNWLESAVYPVIVDPTIRTSLNDSDIDDTYVSQGYPNTNYSTKYIMCTGHGSSSQMNYSLVQFHNLPAISSSNMIIHAGYKLQMNYNNASVNSTVSVHEITSSWNPSTITWNNGFPTYNTIAEDYNIITPTQWAQYEYDVTRIAKQWYTPGANNYGLLLKDISSSGGYKCFSTSNDASGTPYVYFDYTDSSGMESYWDYVSSSIGRGGAANVNLYNGNLVYTHTDLAMNGNRMPVSIAHVFNSNNRNDQIYEGTGWRTNYDQRVSYVNIGGTNYYKYIDEDGTTHYFRNTSGSTWKDESGIGLTLTIDQYSNVHIKDKNDNDMVFWPVNHATLPGYLGYIDDGNCTNNSNRLVVNYTNSVITSITDGAGRITYLHRNANSFLTSIEDPSGRSTYFYYTGTANRLDHITYPDNVTTNFDYDSNGNLTSATNFDGKKVTITYQSAGPYRVTRMEERNGSTYGGRLDFSYEYNRTEVTDIDGRKAEYQFNNFGNTVCVIGPDGSTRYAKFGSGDTTNDINKVILSSKTQKFGNNFVMNHNAENTGYWTFSNVGGSVATGSYATDYKAYGSKSFKIDKTNTADFSHHSQALYLQPNKTYTLSGYIKTANVSTGGYGVFMRLDCYYSGGAQANDTELIFGTTDWQRYSITFTTPSNMTSSALYLLIWGSSGTAWFDGIQLEEGNVVNRYNLVENADFTASTSGVPDYWAKSTTCNANDTMDILSDGSNHLASMSDARFKMIGSYTGTTSKYLNQTLPQAGNAGDSYVLGGWAKGTSVSLISKPSTPQRTMQVEINFMNIDGTKTIRYASFNEDSQMWQYACAGVAADKAYSSINIRAVYGYNANTVWFDGIQLYKEEFGNTYSYDPNGNLITATDIETKNTGLEYNTTNDVIKSTLPGNRVYNYTYDNHHNLLTAVSPMNLTTTNTYDGYGNQTSAKIGNDTNYIRSTKTYTTNGNYVDYITNPFGKIFNYNFDSTKGTLTSTNDPLYNTTDYAYDSNLDRLEGVSMTNGTDTISNGYTYTNDRLTSASHDDGSVSFNFTYNGLGWLTETKVGDQSLSLNDYEDRTGRLNNKAYGNGQTINYTYDDFDRLIKVQLGTTDLYSYAYDNCGNIGYQKDYVNGKEYWYEYDSMERLGKITSKDATYTNSSGFAFNNSNYLSSFKEKIAGIDYETAYTYDNDGRPHTATYGTSSMDLSYDTTLGLVTSLQRKAGGTTQYTTSYSYYNGNGTTSTKSARVQTITNGTETLTYSYDDRGFITQVQMDANNYSQYRYNTFGELIRENYKWGNDSFTMKYAYDVGGNITTKTKHDFVDGDGQVGTEIGTVNYTYDTVWKDKLASYDGRSITYDNIGNPLDDGIWEYTWTQGRLLSQMSNGTTSLGFKYNDSGIRSEKTVNGVTTKYNVIGSKVTWEKTGTNNPIYYLYDAGGTLWGIKYNNNTYFYVHNNQGDIIKIVDSSGVAVVDYKYDAWGKPMTVTGTLASTLGADNPYRYRGYRYDTETGLYYLQSRYYNPEWGRFINADILGGQIGKLFSHNVFAYCSNNPVNFSDPTGLEQTYVSTFQYMVDFYTKQAKTDRINKALTGMSDKTKATIWDMINKAGYNNVLFAADGIVVRLDIFTYLFIMSPGAWENHKYAAQNMLADMGISVAGGDAALSAYGITTKYGSGTSAFGIGLTIGASVVAYQYEKHFNDEEHYYINKGTYAAFTYSTINNFVPFDCLQ